MTPKPRVTSVGRLGALHSGAAEYTGRGMMNSLIYVAAGLVVGLLIGITGIGGGSIMTPILVFGFGQNPSVAVGTDLAFAATTKLAATASLGYSRRIDWRIVGRLALGSVPAAATVALWLYVSHRRPVEVDRFILRALALTLIGTGSALLFQRQLQRLGLRATAATLGRAERLQPALTVLAGLLLGVTVMLTSVGAGALGIVALLYLYPLRLTPDRLVATDIAQALPLTLVAGVGHAALGHVDLPMLGSLLLGSIPGVLIGTRMVTRVPQAVLRGLIAAMLLISGGRMLAA
jgi:hypothetical protein